MKTAHISLRVAIGSSLVLVSLVLLRFFQLTDTDLLWVSLMGVGVLMFVIGSRWVLEGVPRLVDYKGMWPVFCVAMVIAWLIHAGQLESYVAGSRLGRFFGGVTVYVTVALLHLTKVPVVVSGDVLSFGPPSLVAAVQVTPLCGGFLSVLMFIAAFSFVTLDVGRALGLVRLIPLLLSGTTMTIVASVLRVYVVTLAGFYWGWNALTLVHTYLGYALFLTVASLFWYVSLTWSKRRLTQRQASFT